MDLKSDCTLSIRSVVLDDGGELSKGGELRRKIFYRYMQAMLFCEELWRHPVVHQSFLILLLEKEVNMKIDSTQRSVINLAQGLFVDSGATFGAVRFVYD